MKFEQIAHGVLISAWQMEGIVRVLQDINTKLTGEVGLNAKLPQDGNLDDDGGEASANGPVSRIRFNSDTRNKLYTRAVIELEHLAEFAGIEDIDLNGMLGQEAASTVDGRRLGNNAGTTEPQEGTVERR